MRDRIAIHRIPDSNNFAVYDTLMPQIIIASKGEVDSAVEMIKSSALPEKVIRQRYAQNKGVIDSIYIIMTNSCNLACDYCFTKENLSKGHMTFKVANNLINRMKEYLVDYTDDLTVTFYGGEPLLNLDLIQYVMDSLNEYTNIKFQIVTNGTLVTPESAEKLAKYNIQVGVSLDGYAELHDAHRKYVNGNGTYSDAQQGIHLLRNAGNEITLSITLTDAIIDNAEAFISWVDNIGINKITFNLLRCAFDSYAEAKRYYHKAANFMFCFYQKFKSNGVYEYIIFNRLKCLYDAKILLAECAAASCNQITVDTSGNIYSCQIDRRPSEKLGNVATDAICKIKLHDKKSMPLFNNFCKGCYALPLCGGGCPVQTQALSQMGSTQCDKGIDPSICTFAKTLMDLALKQLEESLAN